MRMKKIAVLTMALALSVGGAFTSLADWQSQGDGNWRYQNEDGSWKSNTWWQNGSGKWYSFDGNGYMRKGWFQDADGKWYFLASTGEMQTGLIIIDGKTYFLNPSGDLFLGEKTVNGTTYNFGLYGTTNGQAYISNKWLGNGDKIQMPSGTGGSGGGSSHTSSGGATTDEEKKAEVDKTLEKQVDNIVKDIEGVSAGISKDSDNTTVDVSVTSEAANKSASEVKKAVIEMTESAIKQADADKPATITFPGVSGEPVSIDAKKVDNNTVEINGKTESISVWVDKFLKDKSYESLAGDSSVTVTIGGTEVTYSINVTIE